MEDKDEVQSRSESSPSKEPSYQEPLVEENLMKIESNTNNPSSPLIEKEKQSWAAYHEKELPMVDVPAIIIPEPPINDIPQSSDNLNHSISESDKGINYLSSSKVFRMILILFIMYLYLHQVLKYPPWPIKKI